MKKTIRNSYYAYKLINTKDRLPFYVGKGYGTRMHSHKTEAFKDKKEWTNPHKCNKIRKMLSEGYSIQYDYTLCKNENEAILLEKKWINTIGLDNLTNISAGGQVANPKKKPIDVYNTKGQLIGHYQSTADATRSLGISDEGIIRRCLKQYDNLQTHKGMVFVYHNEKFNYVNKKIKIVIAESDDKILEFNGTAEAAKHLNRSKSCIRQCCKHNWKVGKFKLKYADI